MANRVNVFLYGKKYEVPGDLTIMEAFEYAGYKLVRGVGCRNGFCGACATVYRIRGDRELKACLACSTQVADNMYVATLPFFPLVKEGYDIEKVRPDQQIMMQLYPEIYSCVGCNACTKSCSQGLNVMQYIAHAQRGEYDKCAELSFDCVMCGICSSRCPAGISHPQVAMLARAKCVVIATGGAGRMHYQGFPTSNHYGATADGLILGYRAGAKLLFQDTLQYHPTGVAFPQQIYGALVTEKVRSMGAKLVNSEGEVYVHPLETRDVNAAAVIRECTTRGKGVPTPNGGRAVWLDTPMIDRIHGKGTLEKRLPAMLRMYLKFGIDMRETPILVYPTLHYQNGGLEIGVDGMTCVENLYVAGEAAGGIHGRNRLMGNSLLDVIVFGRNAGQQAGAKFRSVRLGALSLEHVRRYEEALAQANIRSDVPSPKLLPDYTRKV